MNWDRIKGYWRQLKGSARQQWSRLTENDHDRLARKQLAEWLARRHKIDPIHK